MYNFFYPFFRYSRPTYIPRANYNSLTSMTSKKNIPYETISSSTSHMDNSSNSDFKKNERIFLEFGGIKLQQDDLLILCIIYFLYKEKNDDTLLYIALFGLLFF